MTQQSQLSATEATRLGNAVVNEKLCSDPVAYHALLTDLRARAPLVWLTPDEYQPFWLVTRQAVIREVEVARDIFANGPRTLLRRKVVDAQIMQVTGGRPFLMNNLTNMDGAEHNAHRKLTQAWFMPARIKVLEQELRGFARSSIDKMIAMGGQCDFMRDVAGWYPLRTIMHILGVPPEDEALMLRLTQQVLGPDDPDVKTEKVDVIAAVHGFFDYFDRLIAERRASPRDDMATIIAHATVGNDPIGRQEALSYFIIVATAGHDTTSSSLAGGMLALIENPDQLARLRADMSLLPGAIDEILRWVTPVTHFFRTATQDHEVAGQIVRSGEALMMCYPSGNRDEAVFEEPFRFDISRKPGQHISFGYGPHVCLGQHLAKMEMRIFYEELFARIADIELAGAPRWVETNFVGGLKSLPIRYRPTGGHSQGSIAA